MDIFLQFNCFTYHFKLVHFDVMFDKFMTEKSHFAQANSAFTIKAGKVRKGKKSKWLKEAKQFSHIIMGK